MSSNLSAGGTVRGEGGGQVEEKSFGLGEMAEPRSDVWCGYFAKTGCVCMCVLSMIRETLTLSSCEIGEQGEIDQCVGTCLDRDADIVPALSCGNSALLLKMNNIKIKKKIK